MSNHLDPMTSEEWAHHPLVEWHPAMADDYIRQEQLDDYIRQPREPKKPAATVKRNWQAQARGDYCNVDPRTVDQWVRRHMGLGHLGRLHIIDELHAQLLIEGVRNGVLQVLWRYVGGNRFRNRAQLVQLLQVNDTRAQQMAFLLFEGKSKHLFQ